MNPLEPLIWGNHEFVEDGQFVKPSLGILPSHPKWDDFSWVGASDSTCGYLKRRNEWEHRQKYKHWVVDRLLSDSLSAISDSPICIITHGGIASGKTSLVDGLVKQGGNTLGAMLRIDLDLMKRSLPEFQFMHYGRMKLAAAFTQEESAMWAHHLLKKAIKRKMNVVFEGSQKEVTVISQKIAHMQERGYLISVIAVHSTADEGVRRAEQRYKLGGRYVPPEFVRQSYQLCPASLPQLMGMVDLVQLFDNSGVSFRRIFLAIKGRKLEVFDNGLLDGYETTVGKKGAIR